MGHIVYVEIARCNIGRATEFDYSSQVSWQAASGYRVLHLQTATCNVLAPPPLGILAPMACIMETSSPQIRCTSPMMTCFRKDHENMPNSSRCHSSVPDIYGLRPLPTPNLPPTWLSRSPSVHWLSSQPSCSCSSPSRHSGLSAYRRHRRDRGTRYLR